MVTTANKALHFFIYGLFLVHILAYFGGYFWFFDLFSHFVIQYFFLSLVASLFLFFVDKKNYRLWIFAIISIVSSLTQIAPFYTKSNQNRLLAHKNLKFVSVNLNSSNQQIHLFINYIRNYDPDLIFVLEITPSIGNELSVLKDQFPYGKAVMENGNFGIGILSKIPLSEIEIYRQPSTKIPYISARIQTQPQRFIQVIAAHPFPPIGKEGTFYRNDYTNLIAELTKNATDPVILCGDWNASPWSHQIKRLTHKTGFKIPTGSGVIATWPTYLALMKIPLDYCITSPSLHVHSYSRGPDIGSDHFPYQMDISL